MMNTNRRTFIRNTSLAGLGGILSTRFSYSANKNFVPQGKRIGIIGLDTSHSVAFTKVFNAPEQDPRLHGFKIVAAYPHGSRDIESSVSRIPGYTEEVKKSNVEIVNSIEELIDKTDVILLETNDGRIHLEQAIPCIKARKTLFIDKPMTTTVSDAMAIFDLAKQYNVPVFSASSLRYIDGVDEIAAGEIGNVTGADTYSPASLEKTHPDLFWYGIHGVEILFTIMGTGCKEVVRAHTPDTDVVVGTWDNNRIGSFRGIRSGRGSYGGTAYGTKGIKVLSRFGGYNALLYKIAEFFNTGISPVNPDETLEILAFMEAAEESKKRKGAPVNMEKIILKARKKVKI